MANEIDINTKRRLSQRYILWLTAITVIGGWAVALPLYFWLPNFYPPAYPFIMLYFYLWALGFSWLVNRPVRDNKLSTQGYLYFKVAKMVVSILVVGAVIGLTQWEKHAFVLLFLFWYLIYLIFETRFFWIYEKSRKKEAKA